MMTDQPGQLYRLSVCLTCFCYGTPAGNPRQLRLVDRRQHTNEVFQRNAIAMRFRLAVLWSPPPKNTMPFQLDITAKLLTDFACRAPSSLLQPCRSLSPAQGYPLRPGRCYGVFWKVSKAESPGKCPGG